MNEQIAKAIEELAEITNKIWGCKARINVSIHNDGYRSFDVDVVEPDSNLPVEAWKRRSLLDVHKFADTDWSFDRSKDQNEYYRKHKVLLEEESV